MVAEFGHRISLRPKVACRYHFPKGHGIGCTDNRSCRIRYGSSENKSGRVGTFPIGLPVALWLSTASSIGAEPKFTVASTSGTSAVSPVVRSVKGGDYTYRTVSNFTSTAASR